MVKFHFSVSIQKKTYFYYNFNRNKTDFKID